MLQRSEATQCCRGQETSHSSPLTSFLSLSSSPPTVSPSLIPLLLSLFLSLSSFHSSPTISPSLTLILSLLSCCLSSSHSLPFSPLFLQVFLPPSYHSQK